MGSMSPGEIADEKEGHAGPGTIRRAVTSPISYTDQQMMTPNSTSGTPNVFRLHTNAQMNMMGYNQQNHFPFGGMTRLDSLSSTHGNSYGYGIGVVPSSPPNYPHPTVQAIMGTNGVGSPSLRDLNTIPAANPQYPQQQSSSSQHGQQGINIVNNCATPGNYQDYKQDDEYEYYEEQNEVDDPLEENEYDAMYEEPNINNATPGVAQVLANQIKLPPVDEEYYDEDEYYEDEPYGGL